MNPIATLTEQAGGRSLGYWILSRIFLEVPSTALIDDLQRMLGDDATASEEMAELHRQLAAVHANLNEAAVAFTRHLVLGDRKSGEPLPYEAHVREGCLPGECTRQVREMMGEAGFAEVAADAPSPDHLGAELRFMALLCHEENRSWLASKTDAARSYLRMQHRFLTEHLAGWAPGYCAALAERADNGYLRAAARLAAATIRDDVGVVEDICTWIPPQEFTPDPDGASGASKPRGVAAVD